MIPVIGQKGIPMTAHVELSGNDIKLEIGVGHAKLWIPLTPEHAAELAHALLQAASIVVPPKPAVDYAPTYVNR